jgi:hypothetical protein
VLYISSNKCMCCSLIGVKGICHICYISETLSFKSIITPLVSNNRHATFQDLLTLRGVQSLPIDILSMIQSIFKVM